MHETYRIRLNRFLKHREEEEVLGLKLGWARALTFAVGVSCYLGWDLSPPMLSRICGWGMVLALVLFLFLVVWHRRVRARRAWAETMVLINEEALARVARNWSGLPPSRFRDPEPSHPYALDLDVAGVASLFRLLTTPALPRVTKPWAGGF